MRETQQTLCAWAESAFGPADDPIRTLGRATEEMQELVRIATSEDDPIEPAIADHIDEKSADALIILTRLAPEFGFNNLLVYLNNLEGVPPAPDQLKRTVLEANRILAIMLHNMEMKARTNEAYAINLECIAGLLGRACRYIGRDAREAIDAKMTINRKRQWRRDGTGHGYHVDSDGP